MISHMKQHEVNDTGLMRRHYAEMHNDVRQTAAYVLRSAVCAMRITAVTGITCFAVFTVIISLLNLRIGIDLQERTCLGRVFVYRNEFLPPDKYFMTMKLKRKEESSASDTVKDVTAVRLLKDVAVFKKGSVLLKRYFAGPGDTVRRNGNLITAQREPEGYAVAALNLPVKSLIADTDGKIMHNIKFIRVFSDSMTLAHDEHFLTGDSPYSLDSRIIGTFTGNEIELAEVLLML